MMQSIAEQRRQRPRPGRARRAPSSRASARRAAGWRQDHEVLHGAAEHDADQDPERAGQVAELRREDRADERARPGDRGEVVAEDDPAVGRDEVAPVVEPHGRRRAPVVEREDPPREEARVEAVADGVVHTAATRNHAPETASPRASAITPSAQAPTSETAIQSSGGRQAHPGCPARVDPLTTARGILEMLRMAGSTPLQHPARPQRRTV